jgi:hypothetical protein
MNGVLLLIAFAGAFVSLAVAASKRRNPVGWFVLGFLFPLISVIVVLCLPALPDPLESPDVRRPS